jgi:hypothetical protein
MLIKFFEITIDRIRHQKKQYIDRISAGVVPSFDEYKHLCGRIRGLEEAEDIMTEFFEDIEKPKQINKR